MSNRSFLLTGVGGTVAAGGLTGPPVYDDSSASANTTAATLSWNHTASGSNRGVVVFVSQFSNNDTNGTCDYDAVSMLHVDRIASDDQTNTEEMFVLTNPGSGSEVTITYTPAGEASKTMTGAVISLTNCNQDSSAAMVGTPTQVNGAATAQSTSSATDELVISGAYQYAATNIRPTAASGGTERVQTASGDEVVAMAEYAGAATVTVDWQGSALGGSISASIITS